MADGVATMLPMRGLPILCAALLVAGCHTVAQEEAPRLAPVATLTIEQLWDVGFRESAIDELACRGMARRDAERWLNRRYEAQERRIVARLGEKNAPEIILTKMSCSYLRARGDAVEHYAQSLRELEKRLAS